MSSRRRYYLAAAMLGWAYPTLAQTDQTAMAHAAAANQLGVLEYCQGQGAVGTDAVTAERSSIARMPPSSVNTDAAENLGRRGTISTNGSTMTLASIASSRNTTVGAVCKQMGDAAIQTAKAFAGNAAPTGMPGLPQGMTMPSLPKGMTMPTMPQGFGTMPTMPGAIPTR